MTKYGGFFQETKQIRRLAYNIMASVPTAGNLTFKAKKCLCPGVIPGGMGAPDKDKVSFLRNFKMERLQFLDIG